MREQMEQIARHHQETAGCSPDGPPMAGGRPRAGMFVPTLYNQQARKLFIIGRMEEG